MVDGERAPKKPRFVKTVDGTTELNQSALERARRLVGLKGYVTNIPKATMPAAEVIAKYHDLWQVEASFRMSKTDLRARPIFHHDRDAIEAHLSIVFAALAISRTCSSRPGSASARSCEPYDRYSKSPSGSPDMRSSPKTNSPQPQQRSSTPFKPTRNDTPRWHESGQMLKPSARSISRPSSVILSGPHGGIHTQLIRWLATRPSSAEAV